jgi:1-phosphatidylinositol-4-phosphate 5-kinase
MANGAKDEKVIEFKQVN